MNRRLRAMVVAGGLALALPYGGLKAAEVFTLTSPAFQDNGELAIKNAGSDKQ
jgi:hypothetical protein